MADQTPPQDSGITWGKALKGIVKIGGFIAVAYLMATGVESLMIEGELATVENGETVVLETEGDVPAYSGSVPMWVAKTGVLLTTAITGATEMMADLVSAPFKGLIGLFTSDTNAAEAVKNSWDAGIEQADTKNVVGAAGLLGTGAVLASGKKEEAPQPPPKEYKVYGPHTRRIVNQQAERAARLPGQREV